MSSSGVFLNIQAPEDGTYRPDFKAFETILSFLHEDIDLSKAANTITGSVDVYNAERYLWELWETLNDIVRQIPQGHPWHTALVDLVAAIQRAELPTECQHNVPMIWGGPFSWQDLPIFGANWREEWNKFGDINPWNDCNGEQFASWVTFLAKIWVRGILNFKLYTIWILREALEKAKTAKGLDYHIPAAAAWIVHAGDAVYGEGTMWEPSRLHGSPAKAGELWLEKGKPGFSVERWRFWKGRFAEVSSTELEVGIETRRYATVAVAMMEEIEARAEKGKGEAQSR